MKLYIYSKEQDFLKSPHEISNFTKVKLGFRTGLLCTLKDKITVWQDEKLIVYDSVLLVERYFGRRLRKLKKFPVDVHVFDVQNLKKNTLKNSVNISWAILDNKMDYFPG